MPDLSVNLSLDHRVLLQLCRFRLEEQQRSWLEKVSDAVDWAEVYRLAVRGGIAGLVDHNLDGLRLPKNERRRFAVATLTTQAKNRILMEEARRVCSNAERAGLTLIPLKGVAMLLHGVYRDDARSMCDIDVLTRRSELHELTRALVAQGYQEDDLNPFLLRHYHHIRFHRHVGRERVSLELHWKALSWTHGTSDSDQCLLEGAHPLVFENDIARCLHPEDLLLVVMHHVGSHFYYCGQTKWLVDIAEVSRHFEKDISWRSIVEKASAAGCLRSISIAGWLTSALLQASIPDLAGAAWQSQVLRRLVDPARTVKGLPIPPRAEQLIIRVLQQDSLLGAFSYVGKLTFLVMENKLNNFSSALFGSRSH